MRSWYENLFSSRWRRSLVGSWFDSARRSWSADAAVSGLCGLAVVHDGDPWAQSCQREQAGLRRHSHCCTRPGRLARCREVSADGRAAHGSGWAGRLLLPRREHVGGADGSSRSAVRHRNRRWPVQRCRDACSARIPIRGLDPHRGLTCIVGIVCPRSARQGTGCLAVGEPVAVLEIGNRCAVQSL